MNIRSMIKHVAAIITAVGMLLASMAGAVTALAEDSKPTTAVDGPTKPVRIMDNLYQTRYTGDYKLDDYLSANAGGNDDYLAWLRANLNHGKPIPLSTTQACTTLAVTDTDTGHDLMVRNMDWYPAVPGMMVATAPTDGYRSVGVAPVMTGKANATPTTDELETSANIAPLTTMDGVNEKGLSAAILQIHRWQAPNDGKPSISQLAVVRLLLDKAATVDEAISLLGRYDIAAYGDKYASLGGLHYALADATGAKATIEFDGGKMHVTRPTDTYQTTTNTMTWNHEIESDRRWKKVDTAVREAGGSMDERDAFGLLAATPSHSTSTLQWTVAYDLDAKTGIITTRGRTDQARTLTLDGIQTAASPVTVRYDANGGRGTITDMTGNPGDQIDIPSTGVTRSGYTLAGWNTKADGTGASIPAGSYTIPADVTVTDQDGMLAATADLQTNDIRFDNTYTPTPVDVTVKADKRLTGRDLNDGEFAAELKDSDGNLLQTKRFARVPRDAQSDKATDVREGEGTLEFDKLTFDRAGVYTYTVTEQDGNLGGVTYDRTVHTVTVTVTEDAKSHKLVAAVSYSDGEGGEEGILFRNTYRPGDVVVELAARKSLTGRGLKADEFEFELVDKDGKVIDSARNDKDGDIRFKPLTYGRDNNGIDDCGEHRYVIRERNTGEKNVTYDRTEHHVTVTVGDDLQGNLTAKVEYDPTDGTAKDSGAMPATPIDKTKGDAVGDGPSTTPGMVTTTGTRPEFTNSYIPPATPAIVKTIRQLAKTGVSAPIVALAAFALLGVGLMLFRRRGNQTETARHRK